MNFKTRTVIEITREAVKVVQSSFKDPGKIILLRILPVRETGEDWSGQLLELQRTKELNLKHSQIVLILPREHAFLRYLDLPSQNREELKAMIRLQLSNHVPYSIEDVVMDFVSLETNSQGYAKVLVMVIPRETILHFWRIMESAHIHPHYITLSSVGLWQWHRQHQPMSPESVVLVDLDASHGEICCCDSKKIILSRVIPLGVKNIEAQFEELLKQINWTLKSCDQENPGASPRKMIVVSSLGISEELRMKLQQHCGISIQFVPDFSGLNREATFIPSGISMTAASGFLRTDQPGMINLLPDDIKASQTLAFNRREIGRLIIMGIVFLLSLGFCLGLNFLKQKSALNDLEKKVNESQKQARVIQQKHRRVDNLKAFIQNRIVAIEIIDQIYHLLPEGIVLTRLDIGREHNLSFQGFSNNGQDINRLQTEFMKSGYFDNVKLDYVNKRLTQEGEANYFKMTCPIKNKGASNEKI